MCDLREAIYGLRYRKVMDVEHLPSVNDTVKELPVGKEIIIARLNTPTKDDQDPDDRCALPTVSPKESFQAVVTLISDLLQNEKKYTECGVLQKLEMRFRLV